jgi:hypothetical protein
MMVFLFAPLLYHCLQAHPSPKACQSHILAKRGRYASEEENGEDMGQILVLIRFEVFWNKPFREQGEIILLGGQSANSCAIQEAACEPHLSDRSDNFQGSCSQVVADDGRYRCLVRKRGVVLPALLLPLPPLSAVCVPA